MRYIVPPDLIERFKSLRTDYEQRKHVNLGKNPSLFNTPICLGGTNVVERLQETGGLASFALILSIDIPSPENQQAPKEFQTYLANVRTMVAVSLFVKSRISGLKGNSALYQLINEKLGITKENYLDEKDKEQCYMDAYNFVNADGFYIQGTAKLKEQETPVLSEHAWSVFWNNFKADLKVKVDAITTPNTKKYYPVSSMTRPVGKIVLQCVGATAGYVVGDLIAKPVDKLIPNNYQLTAAIGTSIVVFGPYGPASTAALSALGSVVAAKMTKTFCKFGLAYLLGKAGGFVGGYAGELVGLPFDGLYNACLMIRDRFQPNTPQVDGIGLEDGKFYIQGVAITLMTPEELSAHQQNGVTIQEIKDINVELKSVETLPPNVY